MTQLLDPEGKPSKPPLQIGAVEQIRILAIVQEHLGYDLASRLMHLFLKSADLPKRDDEAQP
jgi:hypothetical protein